MHVISRVRRVQGLVLPWNLCFLLCRSGVRSCYCLGYLSETCSSKLGMLPDAYTPLRIQNWTSFWKIVFPCIYQPYDEKENLMLLESTQWQSPDRRKALAAQKKVSCNDIQEFQGVYALQRNMPDSTTISHSPLRRSCLSSESLTLRQ